MPGKKSEVWCDTLPNLMELCLDDSDNGGRVTLLVIYTGRRCGLNYSVIC